MAGLTILRMFILGVGVLNVDRCAEVGYCTSEFKHGAELILSTIADRVQNVAIAVFRCFSRKGIARLWSTYMMLV